MPRGPYKRCSYKDIIPLFKSHRLVSKHWVNKTLGLSIDLVTKHVLKRKKNFLSDVCFL